MPPIKPAINLRELSESEALPENSKVACFLSSALLTAVAAGFLLTNGGFKLSKGLDEYKETICTVVSVQGPFERGDGQSSRKECDFEVQTPETLGRILPVTAEVHTLTTTCPLSFPTQCFAICKKGVAYAVSTTSFHYTKTQGMVLIAGGIFAVVLSVVFVYCAYQRYLGSKYDDDDELLG